MRQHISACLNTDRKGWVFSEKAKARGRRDEIGLAARTLGAQYVNALVEMCRIGRGFKREAREPKRKSPARERGLSFIAKYARYSSINRQGKDRRIS